MSQRYLLPCSCGKTIPVGLSQAGSSVTCQCGQSVIVPTVRGLRALPPEGGVRQPPPKPAAASEINGVNLQGMMFVIGLVLLLAGLSVAGYYGYEHSQIDVADYSAEYERLDEEQIDKMAPISLMQLWINFSRDGLGEHVSPEHVIRREASAYAFRSMVAGIGTTILGFGLIGYSLAGGSSVRRNT